MVKGSHSTGRRAGDHAVVPAQRISAQRSVFARTLLVVPASLLMLSANGVLAATKNTEAASPQRTQAPARATSQTITPNATRTPSRPAASQATPQRQAARTSEASPVAPARSVARPSNSGAAPSTTPKPAAQPAPRQQAVRQVTVPVLGREGPAAAAAQRANRQIAITASEPEPSSAVRTVDVAQFQKIGAPYQVNGTWYVPAHEPDYDETGVASWYGNEFQGKPTANGEIFDMNVVSGAHPTLPIPSLVEVTNLTNGRSVIVRINDRGPFVGSRLIDISARGAELLGFRQQGHTNVRVRYVGPANSDPVVTPENLTEPRRLAGNTGTKPLGEAALIPPPRPRVVAPPPAPVASEQPAPAPQIQQAFVQLGAFSQLANAQRLRDQSANLGPVQVVEATTSEGNPLYRVVFGPVANRAEALARVEEMKAGGISSARVMASLN
jgi:rare lipoprotein A